MKNFVAAMLAASACAVDTSNHWAVIVAGSKDIWNYRHQADAHHAWNVVTRNGIPESNVILFAYDDIADHPNNPLPGQIFNSPRGENVYNKAAIDYSGMAVTPQNFLNVLTGNPTVGGNGKVLGSNNKSKVFVFFSDHGAPGLIAFPREMLYADDLNKAVQKMYAKGMYEKLIFYIEACESGSMFPELANNIGVAAMTASNASQSSWAAYCPPNDDLIGDVHIGSCLGDLFSVNWMEDTEAHDPTTETLLEQHKTVKTLTTESPVQLFGELDFGNEFVGNFQGVSSGVDSNTSAVKKLLKGIPKFGDKLSGFVDQGMSAITAAKNPPKRDLVNSRDAKLHYLFNRVSKHGGEQAHSDLKAELEHRMFVDSLFSNAFPKHFGPEAEKMELTVQPTDYACLRFLMEGVEQNCGMFSDYSLKYVKHLVHVCENQDQNGIQAAADKIEGFCKSNAEELAILQ